MPGVNAEQIAQARSVDLLTYLQAYEPQELLRSGPNVYRTVSHSSLVISNGLWFWNRGQVGGRNALDYLIRVRGMGFVEAVETVLGSGAARHSVLPIKRPVPQRERKTLSLPPPVRFPARMLSYLQGRGISADMVQLCMDAGILFESRYDGSPVCVFVGRDEEGTARFACMRGIDSDIKRDCSGSNKRYGFCLLAHNPAVGRLAVFESSIDALSHACLFPNRDIHRLSLGGTSSSALIPFLERNPIIDQVSLCLDADDAGQTAAAKVRDILAKQSPHIDMTIDPPGYGKDYNITLLHAKAQKQKLAGRRKTIGISI